MSSHPTEVVERLSTLRTKFWNEAHRLLGGGWLQLREGGIQVMIGGLGKFAMPVLYRKVLATSNPRRVCVLTDLVGEIMIAPM